MLLDEGRKRVVIACVTPEIDGGSYAIKRTIGEQVVVESTIIADGHDTITCELRYKKQGNVAWNSVLMEAIGNDRWRASFIVTEEGQYVYTVTGWVDHFISWRSNLKKRVRAGQDVRIELQIGAAYLEATSKRASNDDSTWLRSWANVLRKDGDMVHRIQVALDEQIVHYMSRYPDTTFATTYSKELCVVVDRPRACFSAWYEMFPRSCTTDPSQHGTFKDCEQRLPYIANMGFNVLYFPPIHPIGTTFRKGKNNSLLAQPGDYGSPWAIGTPGGGHKAVHPAFGTLADFRNLVNKAAEFHIEIALDIAFQCSPDHPYVIEHPEWFRKRPDGTIQYAENPPKKYQDIYPFDFESKDWRSLWQELKSIFTFWIEQGVTIFRVDNPHTKSFGFWEWVIADIKKEHPNVLFLAEAFTRPNIMYHLAKIGFTQSYTYFTWRNTHDDIVDYLTELTTTDVREYFRPNFWPNTPDILNEYLQTGGRPAFMTRFVLAATLGASYGIYGPAFELCINTPREPSSEEYLDSEKYEIKHWDLDQQHSLRFLIAQVNRIRQENTALHSNNNLLFHTTNNDQLICYSKHTDDLSNIILVVVNLDPYHVHSGWIDLPLDMLNVDSHRAYQVHDLLTDARYLWNGPHNYVELSPHRVPAHIFRLRRHVRTEHDFDYYM